MTNVITLSWEDMDKLHRIVASKIIESTFHPEIIIGILRCGMVSAIHLAYILKVNCVATIYVRTTPNDEILVKKDCEPIVIKTTPLDIVINKKILLVDTVMASGTSLLLSKKTIMDYNPATVKTAIIVDWNNSPYKIKHGKRPEIDYVGTTADKWPDFPWES